MTPKQKELLDAVTEIKCIHQTIGKLGSSLHKTKPGSKLHKKYYESLTVLERNSYMLSNKITNFILLGV